MATSFPSSIDSFTNPSASDALDSVSVPHADQHANLNDAMVAVQTRLGAQSGVIGTWTSFTPTWTNLTIGNGITDMFYCVMNDVMHITGSFQLGSTSSVGSAPYFTTPGGYTLASESLGQSKMWDITVGVYTGTLSTYVPGNLIQPQTINTGGGYATTSPFYTTAPFTWATGDVMYFSITLKVA